MQLKSCLVSNSQRWVFEKPKQKSSRSSEQQKIHRVQYCYSTEILVKFKCKKPVYNILIKLRRKKELAREASIFIFVYAKISIKLEASSTGSVSLSLSLPLAHSVHFLQICFSLKNLFGLCLSPRFLPLLLKTLLFPLNLLWSVIWNGFINGNLDTASFFFSCTSLFILLGSISLDWHS